MGSLDNIKKGQKPTSNNEDKPQGPARVSRPQIRTPKTLKINGKALLIKEIEEFVGFFMDSLNYEDMMTIIDHYKRTYMNPKRKYVPEGGITDKRNKRILEIEKTYISFKNKFK